MLEQIKNYLNFKKNEQNFDIVFYSESSSYVVYFESIINNIVKDYECNIAYLTSSNNDRMLNNNTNLISTYYIGRGSIRTILFSTLNVKVMVMTMPDLNNSYIRKSNNNVHYVFLPHNMCSTHMVFNKGAFDHYDSFFCVGPYHVKELREAEKIYLTKEKELIKIGYPRLDDIYNLDNDLESIAGLDSLNIIIAPSWNTPGILDTLGDKLINLMLEKGHHVFVRPHRDSRLYISNKLDHIKKKYLQHKNFDWIEGKSSNKYLIKSHILITDWSGSAFSFAFGLGRPVISIDLPPKINNIEYKRFKNKPFELTIRDKIGLVVKPTQIEKINSTINQIKVNYKHFSDNIDKLRKSSVYNFGNSAFLAAEHLSKIHKSREYN